MSGSRSASYVVDFLSSSEGIQLNKAFVRIKDAKLRRRIIDLVRAVAGEEDAEQAAALRPTPPDRRAAADACPDPGPAIGCRP